MKQLTKISVLLLAILAVTLCLFASPTKANAATEGSYTYEIYYGVAIITDVDDSISGSITIPSTLGGYPVTGIADSAFDFCESLTSITIPNGVVGIGDSAFGWCSSVTSISIPKSVTSIGINAFGGCDSLTYFSVAYNNAYYSSDYAGVLYNKDQTEMIRMPSGYSGDYTFPDSLTRIGDYAFQGNTNVGSLTLLAPITSIGDYAFSSCYNLTSVTLGNSVTYIGESAFSWCSGLTSITIPESVISIGIDAFGCCSELQRITVDPYNVYYSNDSAGVLYNKYKTELIQMPCSYSGNYTIPNTVVTIADDAFVLCNNLKSVIIPNSVTTIGQFAFESCESLTSVSIGNRVTSIGDYAFGWCSSLTNVTIPKSVTSIGQYAFGGCINLKRITVDPNNTCYSSDSAGVLFNKDKTELIRMPNTYSGNYTIPSTVVTIGDYALNLCVGLTSVSIPKSVTTIGVAAFDGCEGLTNLTIPNSVITIGDWAFDYCVNLTSITIGNSVTSIGEYAFSNLDRLKEINYVGTSALWETIEIGYGNDVLSEVPMYFVRFPDVKNNTWYYNAVEFAVKNGYFSGNDDGTFAPGKNITRQDFVVVLSRIAGANLSKYSGKTGFADVPANAYYAKAIHWATDNGIISGYNAAKFGVGDPLTREQLVTILSRYAQKKGVNVTPNSAALNKMNSYSDAYKINPNMKNAIAWALYNKVISGMTSTTIAPQGNATRAQVAAILMNINAYKVIPGI